VDVANRQFSPDEARASGERIGIDWEAGTVDLEQFRMGLSVELKHGSQDPTTDVTHDDEVTTGKIALAHLNEIRPPSQEKRERKGRWMLEGRGVRQRG
jgi:hypothetical protein